MVSKVVLASEGFTTDVTGVGSFVCVCTLVDQQVIRLGKVTTTEPTDKLFLWPATVSKSEYYISQNNYYAIGDLARTNNALANLL